MRARRLSWAGVEIETRGRRLLIDAMDDVAPLKPLLGAPLWPPMPVPTWDGVTPSDALVTHRHSDHYDPQALRRALPPGGRVFCPLEIAPELEAAGLNARGVAAWETVHPPGVGDIAITAVPAVDWRCDAQVSWVVEAGGVRVFHGGDTIWHGSWWRIAERFPAFDAVFLPANGVIARLEGMEPSNLPATLTPRQAAIAARLLKAQRFCPIHYGQFDQSETYRQHPDIDVALRDAAAAEGVPLIKAKDGEVVLGSGAACSGIE